MDKKLPYESFSSLSKILISVAEYWHHKNTPFKGNSSTQLGTAIHHFLQKNHHFVTANPFEKRSKDGKEKSAAFEEEFKKEHGRDGVILTKSQYNNAFEIFMKAMDNKKVREFLDACEFEKEIWLSAHESFNLKGYLDCINVAEGKIGEIKTCSYVSSLSEFRDLAYNRNYDMQAFLYKLMAETLYGKSFDHYFIVCTTREPYQVFFFKSSADFLKSGEEKLYKAIKLYDTHIIQNIPVQTEDEEI